MSDFLEQAPRTEAELLEFIGTRLLDTESVLYRQDWEQIYSVDHLPETTRLLLLAEHKLLFITGDESADVISATDVNGNPIYTKLFLSEDAPDLEDPKSLAEYLPKAPETMEFAVSAELYMQRIKSGGFNEADSRLELAGILSEFSDLIYNLVHLTKLDPGFKGTYEDAINQLAQSIGLTNEQALLLAATKYNHRLIEKNGDKDVIEENKIIEHMLQEEKIPNIVPTQLGMAYRTAMQIHNNLLVPRHKQLRQLLQWAINNHVS